MSGFECIIILSALQLQSDAHVFIDGLCFYLEEMILIMYEHVCARLLPIFHLRLRATRRASHEAMNVQNYFYVHVCCLYSNL